MHKEYSAQAISTLYGISEAKLADAITYAKTKFNLDEQQALQVVACANDRYGEAMPSFLRVRNKNQDLVSMAPTAIHRKFKKWQRRFAYVVKPRQVYFTTFMEADNFLDVIEGNGTKALFVNLDSRVTEEVFNRVHTFHEEFALKSLLPSTTRETTRKLAFKNGGSFDAITVDNDGGKDAATTAGRSCTVQRVHGTEVAFWKHYTDFMSGLRGSVPKEGRVVMESTGNGAQGGFYEDVMEVVEKGQQAAPGVWILGEKSVHFFQWWEHPEYTRDTDPLPEFLPQMEERHHKALRDSEAEHRARMDLDPELSEDFKDRALYWRRDYMFSSGFLRDPEGTVRATDREYPGTIRHAFQSTGSAMLSLSLTDLRREEWKRYNAESGLPLSGRLVKIAEGKYEMWPGEDILFWAPPCDLEREPWEGRYVVGGDVGGGNLDSDPDAIWVKDLVLNKYVAVAHGRFGPAKWAEIGMALGYYYHGAKLGHEANNHGIGVSIKLWEAQYPNIYKHDENAETYKGMGFPTTETTRRAILALLKQVYEDRQRPVQIPYAEFYREAAAFGPPAGKPNGKAEGQNGVPDDLIMGMAVTEAVAATAPAPRLVETYYTPEPGTFGAIREMAMGSGAGLRGVM